MAAATLSPKEALGAIEEDRRSDAFDNYRKWLTDAASGKLLPPKDAQKLHDDIAVLGLSIGIFDDDVSARLSVPFGLTVEKLDAEYSVIEEARRKNGERINAAQKELQAAIVEQRTFNFPLEQNRQNRALLRLFPEVNTRLCSKDKHAAMKDRRESFTWDRLMEEYSAPQESGYGHELPAHRPLEIRLLESARLHGIEAPPTNPNSNHQVCHYEVT